ncbi:MAG: NHLP family bacteriocin export ABC transporter permease/ATPase subunit, partial [Limnochordia bacterium]
MSFDSQLQKRLDYDRKAMADAFSDLLSIIGAQKAGGMADEREVQLQSALESIFSALSLRVPGVPDELQEVELRLDYML